MGLARRNTLLLLIFMTIGMLAGCSNRTEMTYVSSGRELQSSNLQEAFNEIDTPVFFGSPVTDAPKLRRSTLASLRSQGPTQSDLADLLTEVLPSNGRSVPYYAEETRIDERDAWIVLELWGSPEGKLDRSRVWAFDRTTGEVIVSTTFR